jgi:uncharacterized protein YfdQ (DUF2303 family)
MSTVPLEANHVDAIAKLAREGVQRHQVIPGTKSMAPRIVWPDQKITDTEGALSSPLRRRSTATLGTMASFIAYVQAYQEPRTIIVGDADEKGGNFTAILDYHERSNVVKQAEDTEEIVFAPATGWSEHQAKLELQATPEWVRWLGICGKDLDQRTFAEFLQDNAADVVVPEHDEKAPNSADLMQVATTLQIKTDVKFASSVNLQNGQVQLTYEEMIEGSWQGAAKMAVPQCFWIAVVPFRGGARYAVRIRLRYRGTGGKAIFRLEMERPHKVVESAFGDMKHAIEEAVHIGVLIGKIAPQARPAI